MLKKSRKGFTLAELLIVVAIIAVLTAIAVPLFVHAIQEAKDRTLDANIRAVRGAAVVEILENQSKYFTDDYDLNSSSKGTDGYSPDYAWFVQAIVTANGDITDFKIVATGNGAAPTGAPKDYTIATKATPTSGVESAGSYYITLWLTELKVAE